jgi:tetrahydromethanopterin S-methyltransferase subunit F
MKEDNMMSYEMYEDFKETMVKTIKTELSTTTNTDLLQRVEQIVRAEQEQHRTIITQLAGRLENIEQNNIKTQADVDNLQTAVESIEIPAELPSRIVQHRISLAIESKGVFWAMIGMMTTIVLLCTMLYWTAKPNYDRIDNDLKYRYLKMKGEATPERITELEELFELNRDNTKIREMKRDVEEYEQTIRQKIILEEQARLKEREAERLNENASRLKNK